MRKFLIVLPRLAACFAVAAVLSSCISPEEADRREIADYTAKCEQIGFRAGSPEARDCVARFMSAREGAYWSPTGFNPAQTYQSIRNSAVGR